MCSFDWGGWKLTSICHEGTKGELQGMIKLHPGPYLQGPCMVIMLHTICPWSPYVPIEQVIRWYYPLLNYHEFNLLEKLFWFKCKCNLRQLRKLNTRLALKWLLHFSWSEYFLEHGSTSHMLSPTPLPLVLLFKQCNWCLFFFLFVCVGVHSWAASIYQQWVWSPPSS